jgi:GT2 family glycosyltransferase
VIAAGGNVGYGRGNNRGLKRTTTEFALILNPDVIMPVDAIGRLASKLDLARK